MFSQWFHPIPLRARHSSLASWHPAQFLLKSLLVMLLCAAGWDCGYNRQEKWTKVGIQIRLITLSKPHWATHRSSCWATWWCSPWPWSPLRGSWSGTSPLDTRPSLGGVSGLEDTASGLGKLCPHFVKYVIFQCFIKWSY